MGAQKNPNEDPRRLAELSALADGTLNPARRAEVREWIEGSEELRQRFEDERRAVALLTDARERERAPIDLRERIESSRTRARTRAPRTGGARRRSPLGVAALAASAVVAVALSLTLPAGSPGSPSVAQAAAVGAMGPALSAPQPRPGVPAQLQASVGSLHFPNWSADLGWRAIGQRRDRVQGRSVMTVYYAKDGHTIAYSIVSGSALAQPSGTAISGIPYAYQSFRLRGRNVVTWREQGHTCLLSAAGLSGGSLAALITRT